MVLCQPSCETIGGKNIVQSCGRAYFASTLCSLKRRLNKPYNVRKPKLAAKKSCHGDFI